MYSKHDYIVTGVCGNRLAKTNQRNNKNIRCSCCKIIQDTSYLSYSIHHYLNQGHARQPVQTL